MTPRAGVKTTLASEMRLPGLPDPKRGPHLFFGPRSPAHTCFHQNFSTIQFSFLLIFLAQRV
jgi:hypothetical protein